VSVRGGIAVEPELGSRSHDTLSQLGPAPLRAGQLLPVGHPLGNPGVDVAPVRLPQSGLVALDALPGPRLDWLAHPADLTTPEWSVGSDSDRVGVRTTAETPLARSVARELPSEGVETGSLQVPPEGFPVLFLADHPVTGGYPVVAVLTPSSIDLAAQLRPGDPLRFRILG
jgi:allophanate hydrolase subunit 2